MPNKSLKIKSPAAAKALAGKQKSKVVKKIDAKKAVVKKTVKKITQKTVKAERVETKIPVSAKSKTASLTASVYDVKGKAAGTVNLPAKIFNAKINNFLMSQAVRVYLANQRQGTVKTKTRGEVDRTTKKVWQQKGTGRARHGSRRAPIFVGGGLAFGPKPRDFSLNLSKKMKSLALFSALSSKLKDKELKIIKGLEAISPKTKIMAQVLEDLGIGTGKKILLVVPKTDKETENVYRAARNIEGVEISSANLLNTYKVLDNTLILMMKDSIESLKNTFIQHPTSSRSTGLRGASK